MLHERPLPFIPLFFLISFASVNAVLFTPGLPDIMRFFHLTEAQTQGTITWFLIGYTFGQLMYGPLANRLGRKPALYLGICLQIVSSLVCVAAGFVHIYGILVFARLLLGLGSGVGLKMTFTLVNECCNTTTARQYIAYLTLGFAITPGLSVALGGMLTHYWGWQTCFYMGAFYGVLLFLLVLPLPETQNTPDREALKLARLLQDYKTAFQNKPLIIGGLLMGCSTCFVYLFAALAPFIGMNILGLNSSEYGTANLLPPIGLVLGSLASAKLSPHYSVKSMMQIGCILATLGSCWMGIAFFIHAPVLWSLFSPMILLYFGSCFILANASSVAMATIEDKAHGAAVMSFINMGLGTAMVLSVGIFPLEALTLPSLFLSICVGIVILIHQKPVAALPRH